MVDHPESSRKPWHRHFETVGSITAIVVGLAALYVSWDQGRVMREEVRASVWPAVQLDGFVSREGSMISIGLNIANAGVGPALIRRISVFHEGELVRDFDELAATMPADADASRQTVAGRILGAGDKIEAFSFRYPLGPDSADAVELERAMSDAWELEVCYCSSLGQCWISRADGSTPMDAETCDQRAASRL
jgi:hypothetical protein